MLDDKTIAAMDDARRTILAQQLAIANLRKLCWDQLSRSERDGIDTLSDVAKITRNEVSAAIDRLSRSSYTRLIAWFQRPRGTYKPPADRRRNPETDVIKGPSP